MLYSKANLLARAMSSKDSFDQAMNGLYLTNDGATVGGNPRGIMVVSPVVVKVPTPRGIEEEEIRSESGMVLELDHVDKVIKNISKDKRTELQHCALTVCSDSRKVELTTWDRSSVHKISNPPKMQNNFPNWKDAVKRIVPKADDEGAIRLCVNSKELIHALKALEEACPARGDYSPVWIQIGGGGMLLRSQNDLTKQTAICIVLPHEKIGGWLKWSNWEEKIWGGIKKVLKKIRKI